MCEWIVGDLFDEAAAPPQPRATRSVSKAQFERPPDGHTPSGILDDCLCAARGQFANECAEAIRLHGPFESVGAAGPSWKIVIPWQVAV